MAGNEDDVAMSGSNCLIPHIHLHQSPAQLQYPMLTVCHNVMLSQYGPPSLPHSLPQMQQRLQPHHSSTPCTLRNSSRLVRIFTFFAPCLVLKAQRFVVSSGHARSPCHTAVCSGSSSYRDGSSSYQDIPTSVALMVALLPFTISTQQRMAQ